MCGRYLLYTPPDDLRRSFSFTRLRPNLEPRFNIAVKAPIVAIKPTATSPAATPTTTGMPMHSEARAAKGQGRRASRRTNSAEMPKAAQGGAGGTGVGEGGGRLGHEVLQPRRHPLARHPRHRHGLDPLLLQESRQRHVPDAA
jgi:hypothetical protein